tara:strand:- start:1610 stop:1915 length:306 start_codon:yes stop_codon:yes gene_type:complete
MGAIQVAELILLNKVKQTQSLVSFCSGLSENHYVSGCRTYPSTASRVCNKKPNPPYPIIYSPAHNTVNQSPNRYFLYLIVVFLIELALDVSRLYLKEEMTE